MAGAIYIKGVAVTKYKRSAVSDDDEWPSKYSMLFVELDDGVEFSFTDKRRFARVRLLEDPASVPPISDLGPDAFLEPMTDDEFVASLSKKKIGIKALLLQQSYISGIGNWIADEVLYQARIHPEQPAAALSRECCVTLNKCIKEVLKEAVEVGADSSQFPSNWIFHSREKKPGKAFVDGKKIEFIKAGGRTTAYVPGLQKKTGDQAAKGVSKKSNRGKGNQHGNDGNDVDELENDEDNNAETTKGKKGRKPQGQVKKKLAAKRKSDKSDEENDNDDVDELENDEDNNAETTKGKKVMKPQGQVKKKLAAKIKSDKSDEENDDDDVDELENEEDNNAETTKGKKGRKPQGQVKKKLAAKIKSDKSDEENDEDDLQENDEDNNTETTKGKKGRKPQGQVKNKLAAKRKSDKIDEENDDDAKNKRSKKEADDKPSKAGKSKKEKLQSNQKNKKAVKKSK